MRLIPLVLAGALLAGCRPGPAAVSAHDVEYELGEYYFRGPDTLPAGRVNLKVRLNGKEGHVIDLIQLKDGKRIGDLMAAGESAYDSSWVAFAGAGITAMEGTPVYSLVLEPGVYVLLCYFHTDGAPHFARGMIKEVTVTGAAQPLAPPPRHDAEIVMVDYGYEMPVPLAAGTRTLRVVNPSPQPHEVIIARLKDGMTLEDVRTWEEAGAGNDSSPWVAMGGVGDVGAGDSLYMTRDFPRGTYRLACFYVTPGAKENHARLGMKTYIEVN